MITPRFHNLNHQRDNVDATHRSGDPDRAAALLLIDRLRHEQQRLQREINDLNEFLQDAQPPDRDIGRRSERRR
jgi:uncharacterized protein YlxW (UPF0749 family)